MMNDQDIAVKIEGVSKKFCTRLKQSLLYGVQDLGREMVGLSKTKALRKNEFWAVNEVSLEVKRGGIIGLIGPNGSGKSTLLKMLNGLIKPDKGRITMSGRVCALIELGTGFNPILTGRENVYINGAILGLTKKEIDAKFDEIVAFSEIEEFIDTPIRNYSSGMKVRLGFAVAAHMEPDVLLIDEVLAVGDVRFKLKCFDHLERLREKGVAMIIVSHGLGQLSRVCDRVIVFEKGRIRFNGDIQQGILEYDQLMIVKDPKKFKSVNPYREKIKVTGMTKNASGEKTNTFKTGDDVIVELHFSAKTTFKDIQLGWTLDSASKGILGSYWAPYQDFTFDIEKGNTVIHLTLPNIILLTGSFFVNLSLFHKNGKELLVRQTRFVNIIVHGPLKFKNNFGVSGVVDIAHDWTIIDQPKSTLE